MSIFLAGARPGHVSFPEIFDRFAADVTQHAGQGGNPRIAVAVHAGGGDLQDVLSAYTKPLEARIECEVVVVPLEPGKPADPSAFEDVHGVLVGGGLTPGYWDGLRHAASAVSKAVAGGVPYLGFSAGAMVAPHQALIGGYRINGVEVCGEECSEGLEPVDIREGLGVAPFSVDVHAAQAGTLSRAVGAVAAGLVQWAVAIDENTAVVLESAGGHSYSVIGSGNVWDIRQTGGAALVSVRSAG